MLRKLTVTVVSVFALTVPAIPAEAAVSPASITSATAATRAAATAATRAAATAATRAAATGAARFAGTSAAESATTSAAARSASFSARRSAAASRARAAAALRVRGVRVVAAARAQRGKPYRHGAAGPGAFDCSGLTGYAYRTVHVKLPRTAQQQHRSAHPISRAAARPGDLVFWVHGKHAYHVGVYAGGGRVWHSPKPGDHVKLARIWSANQVRYGRITP